MNFIISRAEFETMTLYCGSLGDVFYCLTPELNLQIRTCRFFSHPIPIARLFKGRPLFSGGAEYVCILFEKSKPRRESESIVTQLCLTLCNPMNIAPRVLSPWDSSDKNTGVGCCALLQGIFPTQGSVPGLLHCRQILYCLSQQGTQKGLSYMCSVSFPKLTS